MRLPQVLEHSLSIENKITQLKLVLFFDPTLVFFKGHFDDAPVLPGIAQTDFVLEFSAQFLEIDKAQILNIPQLKFSKVILPKTTLSLHIEKQAQRLIFRYCDDQENTYSSGKITLC